MALRCGPMASRKKTATAAATAPSHGYSGTPLLQKLGFKPGHRVTFIDPPPGYRGLLGPVPNGMTVVARASKDLDAVHVFVSGRAHLGRALP